MQPDFFSRKLLQNTKVSQAQTSWIHYCMLKSSVNVYILHYLHSKTCRLGERLNLTPQYIDSTFIKNTGNWGKKKFCHALMNLEIPPTFLLSKHVKTMELLLAICHVKFLEHRSFSWTEKQPCMQKCLCALSKISSHSLKYCVRCVCVYIYIYIYWNDSLTW